MIYLCLHQRGELVGKLVDEKYKTIQILDQIIICNVG